MDDMVLRLKKDGNTVYNVGKMEERSIPSAVGSSAKGGAHKGNTSLTSSVPNSAEKVKGFDSPCRRGVPEGHRVGAGADGQGPGGAGRSGEHGERPDGGRAGDAALTFAAPVIINGDIVNVGVVIQFQAEERPRAVNIDYNGRRFRTNNEASRGTGSRVDHYSQGTSLPTRDASKISISNSAEKVKGKFSLETADDQDIRYDLTGEEARKAPDPGHPNTLVTKGLFKSDQEVQLYA